MRIILSGIFLMATAAHAQTSVTCQSPAGEVRAEFQCDTGRYLVTYNFPAEGEGQFEADLLTTGLNDLTFEEIATPGEGVASFLVYGAGKGVVGDFGGKGLSPTGFKQGECSVLTDAVNCP